MNPIIIIILCVLGVLILSFLVFLFLIKPGNKREEMGKFLKVKYAHRGLHGDGRAENSMSAFKAAVDAGYGIELDVRLSSDGELMVFHDPTLDRMTGVSGKVIEKSAEELSKIKLGGTEDTIPTFKQVLELVNGKVPLLVEIKQDASERGVSEKTVEVLKEYTGDYMVESFNPLALAVIKKQMPGVVRGILSQNYLAYKKYRKPLYFLIQNFVFNVKCRPDFIAYRHTDYKNCAFRLVRGIFGADTVAWTVRSKKEEDEAYKHGFKCVIFESYIPEKK